MKLSIIRPIFALIICSIFAAALFAGETRAGSPVKSIAKGQNQTTPPSIKNQFPPTSEFYRLSDSQSTLSEEYLKDSVKRCSDALSRNPNNVSALLRRGMSYWHLEEHARACVDLERALALSPSMAPATIYRILGECYAGDNKPEKAIAVLTKAIKMEGGVSLLYLRRAQAYAQAEKFVEAVKDADQVVALNPKQHWALELRARLNMNARHYEDAVRDYSLCIKVAPREPTDYAERAKAYEVLGKKSLAAADRKMRDSLNWNFDK